MLEFFLTNFDKCLWLAIILIAMIPTLEGRVALPFAMTLGLTHFELTPFLCICLTFIGSIIPSIPVLFLIKRLKKKTSGFIHDKFTNKIKSNYFKNTSKIENKSKIKTMLNLSFFVAIPLPLTGVWSGSIIGGFLNLTIFESFWAICFGSIISTLIIYLICILFGNSVFYFLIFSIAIIFIFLLIRIFISHIKRNKKNHDNS